MFSTVKRCIHTKFGWFWSSELSAKISPEFFEFQLLLLKQLTSNLCNFNKLEVSYQMTDDFCSAVDKLKVIFWSKDHDITRGLPFIITFKCISNLHTCITLLTLSYNFHFLFSSFLRYQKSPTSLTLLLLCILLIWWYLVRLHFVYLQLP